MGNYTKRQRAILAVLSEWQSHSKSVISLDVLHKELATEPTMNWTRNGIANTMRDLIRKLPDDDCLLRSNGLRGRGHKVEYLFNGNIGNLLREPIAA